LKSEEIKQLVRAFLEEINKEFPNEEDENVFYEKVKLGNPLYILVALEELRLFGDFERLADRIKQLPDNLPDLFDQVLLRIEQDFSQPLVKDCMALIACGRQGMTARELQDLLYEHTPRRDNSDPAKKLPDMIWARLYRSLKSYLFKRSDVIDFFHGQLKEAVGKRYLEAEIDRNGMHEVIATYFEKRWQEPYTRALDELPHQLTKASNWTGLERILCDLRFIEGKSAAGMSYDLISDYNEALMGMPEAKDRKQNEEILNAKIKKYTGDLIAYAKGEQSKLEIITSVEPWIENKFIEEERRIKRNPERFERILGFSHFVNHEIESLDQYGVYPGFVVQHAYNSAISDNIVNEAKHKIRSENSGSFLLRHSSWMQPINHHPACLRTIKADKFSVHALAITPDCRWAVTGGSEQILRLWDVHSGKCLHALSGHSERIETVSISADGRLAVSGGMDKTLRVWDLKSGQCLFKLDGHTANINSVALSADGRYAVSGDWDNTLNIWDIDSGECLRNLKGHTHGVMSVALSSNSRFAISASWDRTLRVWDIKSGQCIRIFEGHTGGVYSVALSADSRLAISASWDETLRAWDLESGKCIYTLKGHSRAVHAVAITADGRLAASTGEDRTLRLWDLDSKNAFAY